MTASTATTAALAIAQGGTLRSEPASTTLVLYALAAVNDADTLGADAWPHEVAAAAGLSEGTVRGHLNRLARKGAAWDSRGLWRVRAPRS